MKTTEEILSKEINDTINSCLDEASRAQSLFFDIETTGLSAKSASIYLIGTAALKNGNWVLRQWFAENLADEEAMLGAFLDYAGGFQNLIHFNGTTFDIPFVQARAKKYGLNSGLSEMNQLDIYRRISPFKNMLKLSNCKQKTLEEFLGIFREDPFNGGQLIELYKAYRQKPDVRLLKVLLLHNADDIRGMLTILPVLSYPELLSGEIRNVRILPEACGKSAVLSGTTQAERTAASDCSIQPRQELILQFDFAKPVPKEFSLNKSGCFLSAGKKSASVKLPVFCGELKYFYPDYKNYSYLPAEDNAIHKSVAVYVDKSHRVPATPETCYTRKAGEFVPCFCENADAHIFHKNAPAAGKKGKVSAAGTGSKSGTSAAGKSIPTAAEWNDFLLLEDVLTDNLPEETEKRLTAYAKSVLAYLLK